MNVNEALADVRAHREDREPANPVEAAHGHVLGREVERLNAELAHLRTAAQRAVDAVTEAGLHLPECDDLQLELHRERMTSLRRAHRAVGGVVHHLDGDVTNNDPGNLVVVDPAERGTS